MYGRSLSAEFDCDLVLFRSYSLSTNMLKCSLCSGWILNDDPVSLAQVLGAQLASPARVAHRLPPIATSWSPPSANSASTRTFMNEIQLHIEFIKSSKPPSEDFCLQTRKTGVSQSFIRVRKVLVESPFVSLSITVCTPTTSSAAQSRGLLTRGDLRSPTCQMTHVIFVPWAVTVKSKVTGDGS